MVNLRTNWIRASTSCIRSITLSCRNSSGGAVDRGVFINYRGADSAGYGVLLYNELARQFGVDRVFMDCESIPAGENFVVTLLERVRSAQVVLAVIGPDWLTASDDSGRRRIDDPEDWTRRELAEALGSGIRVVPVLTDLATLPAKAELPADIAALSECQYRYLRRREANTDLARLVADLTSLDTTLAEIANLRSSNVSSPESDLRGDKSATGKYVVDARGATAIQVGDGNVQHVDARQAPARRRVERS